MRSCTTSAYLLGFVRKPRINCAWQTTIWKCCIEDTLNPTATIIRMDAEWGRTDDAWGTPILLRQIKFHAESLLAFSRSLRLLNFVSTWQVGSNAVCRGQHLICGTFCGPGKHELASRVADGSHCQWISSSSGFSDHNIFGFNKQFSITIPCRVNCVQNVTVANSHGFL